MFSLRDVYHEVREVIANVHFFWGQKKRVIKYFWILETNFNSCQIKLEMQDNLVCTGSEGF